MLLFNVFFILLSIGYLFSGKKLISLYFVLTAQLFIPQWDVWVHGYLSIGWIVLYCMKYRPSNISKKSLHYFLVYCGVMLFLCLFSEIPIYRSLYSTIMMVFTLSGLAVILSSSVRKRQDVDSVILYFFSLTFLSSIYSIYCLISMSNPYTDWMTQFFPRIGDYTEGFSDDIRLFIARVTGVFVHPLVLGEFSLLASCLIMIFSNNNRYKYWFYLVLVITIISIFLSGTRSCILSLFVFFVVYFSIYVKRLKIWVASILLLLPIAYYGYNKLDRETKYLIEASVFFWDETKSSSISGSSVTLRQNQLSYTFNESAKVLAVGHGPGFITYSTKIKKRSSEMAGYESIVFSKIAEEGIVGFSMFLFVIWSLYSNTVKKTPFLFKRKVQAYYISYLVCILMTNIQGTGHVFFFGCALLWCYKNYYLCEAERLKFIDKQ